MKVFDLLGLQMCQSICGFDTIYQKANQRHGEVRSRLSKAMISQQESK
jgi:hypothetical protein